ncbi:Dermatan-Sulfate Epimerase [Manis pentadactyla]|nr:Dermatan-Sulfate Epimerase [Manis pentadactyla]
MIRRSSQPRLRRLLSADRKAFLNLWFTPCPSEALVMFKTLPEKGHLITKIFSQLLTFSPAVSQSCRASCFHEFCFSLVMNGHRLRLPAFLINPQTLQGNLEQE